MSLATLETAILAEMWTVTGNVSLKKKHIMEWSTSPVDAREGELLVFLPGLKIHVAYVLPTPRKRGAR